MEATQALMYLWFRGQWTAGETKKDGSIVPLE